MSAASTARTSLGLTVVIVVGLALALRGVTDTAKTDPTASMYNAGPRGLLALDRFLDAAPTAVTKRLSHTEPLLDDDTEILLVPAPERAAWTTSEVSSILQWVHEGHHLVILCDDDSARNHRLEAYFEKTSVRCRSGDPSTINAHLLIPSIGGVVRVDVGGDISIDDDAVAVTVAIDDDAHRLAVDVPWGAGSVRLVHGAVFANDGLALESNAALAHALLSTTKLQIDEAHHVTRRDEVLRKVMARPGPLAGAMALLLLVPLTLLGRVPRRGDPPGDEPDFVVPAARTAAQGMAALLRQVDDVDDKRRDDFERGDP